MDDDRLRKFAALIKQESRVRSGKPIPTNTPEQAAIVLEAFFSCANEHVRIVTGHLNARIYGRESVIVEAKKFLAERKRVLTIIFLTDIDAKALSLHPLLSALQGNSNLSLMQARPDVRDALPYHFSVVDNDTYRFKRDASSHGAITTFGDPQFAKQLLQVFYYLYRSSQLVSVGEMAL